MRRIERDIVIYSRGTHYSCHTLMNFNIFDRFWKYSCIKYIKIRPVGAKVYYEGKHTFRKT